MSLVKVKAKDGDLNTESKLNLEERNKGIYASVSGKPGNFDVGSRFKV
tara:strand:- start:272 stop:415 length:144 start_codon:yes stop_codon:yes gene_type:complete